MPLPSLSTAKKRLLYDIIHYIDVESEDMGALQKLSETFGYSYSYIADLFSRNMGEPLKEYFTRRRFERATQLLEDGMSVTQIADMLGYKSIHSFSRAFTRRFWGIAPGISQGAKRVLWGINDEQGEMKMKVAVIGCGNIANAAHIPAYMKTRRWKSSISATSCSTGPRPRWKSTAAARPSAIITTS